MTYQTILSHVTGRIETLTFKDAGAARASFADSKVIPFYESGFLQMVPGAYDSTPITLERFTRH